MELLLPLLASANSSLLHYLQMEVLTYLDGVKSAVFVSDDPQYFDFNFPFPTIHMNMNKGLPIACNPLSAIPEAYILDLRNDGWPVKQIRNIKRDTDTKVLVITNMNTAVSVDFFQLSFCSALYLAVTEDNITVIDKPNQCKGIGGASLQGCHLNVSFMDLPPRISFNGHRLGGAEGLLIQTSAEQLGIRLGYTNRHDTEWGQFDPPQGMFGDVFTGASIVGIGSLYPSIERQRTVDLIICCRPVALAWAVPTAAGPAVATWFVVLVSELSLLVWIGLGLSYVVAAGAAMCVLSRQEVTKQRAELQRLNKPARVVRNVVHQQMNVVRLHNGLEPKHVHEKLNCKMPKACSRMVRRNKTSLSWLHLLALMIGIPQEPLLSRRFAIVVIFFGFVVASSYTSKMSSILTAPPSVADITTLQQLVDANLRLLIPTTALYFFAFFGKFLPDDPIRQAMAHKVEAFPGSLDEVLPLVALQRDSAYFRHGENLAYHTEKDPVTAGKIHVVDEFLEVFSPVFIAPKYSCYTPTFHLTLLKICQTGLVEKWARDFGARPQQKSKRGPRVLTLDHAAGFMYLLAFGWAIAVVAFLLEHIVFLAKRKYAARNKRADKTIAVKLVFVRGALPVMGDGFIAFLAPSR